jgi:chorismate mutase-like protein
MAAVQSAVSAAGSLQALRRRIDSIDDSMHDLLMRRAEAVAEVAKAKKLEGGADAPLFRPGREAEILRRLIGRNRGPLPAGLIVRVWRDIIVESTRLQGPFAVAVAPGRTAESAREHFGGAVLRPTASAAAVIAAVAKRRAQLGVLPLPGGRGPAGRWWPRLPADIRILARLPFLRPAGGRDDAVVIGRQPFETSTDDSFYVAVAWTRRAGRHAPLPAARVLATVRRAGRAVSLIETATPFDELRARLGAAGTAEFLGGYARPIARREPKVSR